MFPGTSQVWLLFIGYHHHPFQEKLGSLTTPPHLKASPPQIPCRSTTSPSSITFVVLPTTWNYLVYLLMCCLHKLHQGHSVLQPASEDSYIYLIK